jgi:hypothetical protein
MIIVFDFLISLDPCPLVRFPRLTTSSRPKSHHGTTCILHAMHTKRLAHIPSYLKQAAVGATDKAVCRSWTHSWRRRARLSAIIELLKPKHSSPGGQRARTKTEHVMSTIKGDSDFKRLELFVWGAGPLCSTRPSSFTAIISTTKMLDTWEHLDPALADVSICFVALSDKSVESTSPGYTFTRPRRLSPFSKRTIPILASPLLLTGVPESPWDLRAL